MTAIEYLRGPNIRQTFITVLDLNPDQVHSIDAFFLRKNPSVQTLVWFVQSASEQSLFQKGDGHPENTDWTKWGEEVSTIFFNEKLVSSQNEFVEAAKEYLNPLQQAGLAGKLWEYGLSGTRKDIIARLVTAFWTQSNDLGQGAELIAAFAVCNPGLPQDLADRLPGPIREVIKIVAEPIETISLD